MKSFGVELNEGTFLKTANIEKGTAWPSAATTPGQLFYRSDLDSLYYRNTTNTDWNMLASAQGSSISLNDILDVTADNPNQDDVIAFNTTSQRWEATAQSGSGGGGNTSILTDNGNGTYTHDDGTGTTAVIDTRSTAVPYDNSTSGMTATDAQDAIDEVDANLRLVSFVDNANGTYTSNDGTGNPPVNVNTNAIALNFSNATSGLTAVTVQAAVDEIVANMGKLGIEQNISKYDNQSGQSNFAFSPTGASIVQVFINGIKLNRDEYSESASQITLVTPVGDNSDVIETITYSVVILP